MQRRGNGEEQGMYKILITIAMTGLLVLFGIQNSDHVPMSLILGSPVKIRLVFLLAVAASCGFLFSHIQGLGREVKLKREIRKLTGLYQSAFSKKSILEGSDE